MTAVLLNGASSPADPTQKLTRLDIPVYFLHGKYDDTVSYPLAQACFDRLEAPLRGFCTCEQSAHTPFSKEPERTRESLCADLLKGMNGPADPAGAP